MGFCWQGVRLSQVDNTTRENKNGAMLGYLSWLTATGAFRLTALISSRVGHTHNRLGTGLIKIVERSSSVESMVHCVK